MSNPRPTRVRAGRYLWLGLALVALVVLGYSSVLSARSLDDAETKARLRAETVVATALQGELSPQLASEVISGADRRDLLELVRAQILSDDRVARVRIWRPDGLLIFSSAPGDDGSDIVAGDHLPFDQAAGGVTAAVVGEATGSADQLLETFVPMRVPGATAPHAVAEIDQRYSAIRAEANRTWRPLQIGLAVAIAVAAVLFGLSFVGGLAARAVGGPAERPVGEPSTVPDDRTMPVESAAVAEGEPRRGRDDPADRRLRDAQERANAAERRARRAEERRADAERRLREATTTLVPPDILAYIHELENNLKNEMAEREQTAEEVQRLGSALEAKQAELALARDGASGAEAETARAHELVQEADQRAAEAERRSEEAERSLAEAESRAEEAEQSVAEAEKRAKEATRGVAEAKSLAEEAEQGVAEARRRAEEAEKRQKDSADRIAAYEAWVSELERALRAAKERASQAARDAGSASRHEESKAAAELRAAQAETTALKKRVAKLEASLADERATFPGRGQASRGNGAERLEIELLRAERDVAIADLRRAQDELETMRARIAEMESLRGDEIS